MISLSKTRRRREANEEIIRKIDVCLRLDARKPTSFFFKLDLMIDTTELYRLIISSVTLT